MESAYIDIIQERSKNIGSLCFFLGKNKALLDFIGENIPKEILDRTISERVYYYLNKIDTPKLCICGGHLKFIGFKHGHHKTCGDTKCIVDLRKKTNTEKYGVDNPLKSSEIINKRLETINEKWKGHYMNDPDIKNKFKETMNSRYGVDYSMQSEQIKEKSKISWENNPDKQTIIDKRSQSNKNKSVEEKRDIQKKKEDTLTERFGSYNNFIEHLNNSLKEKSIEKWGVTHHFYSKEVISKRVESYEKSKIDSLKLRLSDSIEFIEKFKNLNLTDDYIKLSCLYCENTFDITRQYLDFRIRNNEEICLICNPKKSGTSKIEQEVFDFISQYVKSVNRYVINDIECDLFIEEHKLSIEVNGLYWHSDIYKGKNYHLDKKHRLKDLGINLIHIWEDDWILKKDMIKSYLLSKLNIFSEKIGARKCIVKQIVDNKTVRDFLDENHIQGFVGSSYKFGLYYKEELVSIMTFGKLRKSLGNRSDSNSLELLRFCNKKNTQVIGGASKLFKFAISNMEFDEIISYADYSRSNGEIYFGIGFDFVYISDPNYHYVVDGVRKHRFSFRKDVLVLKGFDSDKTEKEIMESLDIPKIWDCGVMKFNYIKKCT